MELELCTVGFPASVERAKGWEERRALTVQAPLLAKARQPPGLAFVDTALAADRSRPLQGAGRSARCPGGTVHSPRWPEGTEEAVRTPSSGSSGIPLR